MLFIDIKFLTMIGHRLPGFVQRGQYLWNCRCIICGDSKQNKRKQRGYFFRAENHIAYKCHNCLASMPFGLFLRDHGDASLYEEYRLERYMERRPPERSVPTGPVPLPKPSPVANPLHRIATSIRQLSEDHEAIRYLRGRLIPEHMFSRLWYLPHTKDITELAPQYQNRLTGKESRIIFPLYNDESVFSGVGMRAIDTSPEIRRYINIKFLPQDTKHQFFGLPDVDPTKRVYVVEGAMDSLFLPNAIACNTSDFSSVKYLGFQDVVYIWDNQPRNKEVCKIQERMIAKGISTVIWPERVGEKDINDMVKAGRDVLSLVENNTYTDIAAAVKFSEWKKC